MTYAEAQREAWKEIVSFAAIRENGREDIRSFAKEAGVSEAALRLKVRAVRHYLDLGYSTDDIVALGQRTVVSVFNGVLRRRQGERVQIRFDLPVDQRIEVDKLFDRLKGITGSSTSEELWDFLLSVFADMPDSAIRQLAGTETK